MISGDVFMKDVITGFDEAYKGLENSDIISEYLDAKEKAKEDKEIWAKIREFQKIHTKLSEQEKRGETDFGYLHYASSTYFSLLRNPIAERFFKAENELLKVLKHIEKGIDEILVRNGIKEFGSEE